jgi:catechol 2,3-dioxygenase-like lactoylglutathione lyase family enzyme
MQQKALPQPLIGEVFAITMATKDIDTSIHFYKKLGFEVLVHTDFPAKLALISDGAIQIVLRDAKEPYLALTYFVPDSMAVANLLSEKGLTPSTKPSPTDMLKRFTYQSPDGLTLAIVNNIGGFTAPNGPSMLKMQQSDYFNPNAYTNKTIGMFGELACPVSNLEASIAWWKPFGFEPISTFSTPYSWAIISDGLSVIGLHQSTHFSQPTMTFFASDMKSKIENLHNAGIDGFSENGGKKALDTPEAQQLFLFNLGM